MSGLVDVLRREVGSDDASRRDRNVRVSERRDHDARNARDAREASGGVAVTLDRSSTREAEQPLKPSSKSATDSAVPSASTVTKRSEAPAVRTTFERFELKYWVTEPVADRMIRFASPYLERDPHSLPGSTRTRNVSLYLDTRSLYFWHMHTSGAPDRYKLRVRGYGDPPQGLAFFEIKRKVKSITLKARSTLPVGDVRRVLTGSVDMASCAERDRKHLESFVCMMKTHRAEPKVLVASYREAFVSRFRGEDVRMTIDRDVVYQPARHPELAPDPRGWIAIGGELSGGMAGANARQRWYGRSRALVELKFRGAAPSWMGELVSRFQLQQEGFSKYVTAIAHMHGRA